MTFTPLVFSKFKITTLNLEAKYSILLKRYKIVDEEPGATEALVRQSSLDVLIARTNQVIKCNTGRETQREIFNQLVNELRQIPKEEEDKIKQATSFLLGALIHRYFRLLKEYKDYNAYAYWTYWGKCNVTDCRLFKSIRTALKFKDLDVVKRRYEEDDLRTLDVVTLVRSLEVFRDNMYLEDEKKVPRYMNYAHFAEDEHFKTYLQDIIDIHSKRGAAVLKRFKAIEFIQSLAKQIEKWQLVLLKDIEKWCKAVAKEHKKFAAFRELSIDSINDSIIKHVESESARNALFNLFYTPLIQDELETLDHSTLFAKMKECFDYKCGFMLFGGYVLLLSQTKVLDDNLLFSIQEALGLKKSLNELTKKDLLNGVKFLKQFVEIEPNLILNFDFFYGKAGFDSELANAEKELTQYIFEERLEEKNAAIALAS